MALANRAHSAAPVSSERMSSRRLGAAVAGLGGVALTWWLHRPLWAELGARLPGEAGSDIFRAHWSLWLAARHWPDWPMPTQLAAFPSGADVAPFPGVTLWLAGPLVQAVGPDVALPLVVAVHVLFAFVAAAWCAGQLGARAGGRLLAGALFATQPVLGGALRDGTLEMLAAGWMPLVLGAVIAVAAGRLRWIPVAALAYLATCLESVYLASFTALAVLFALTTVRSRRGLIALAVTGVLVAVGALGLVEVFGPVLDHVRGAMANAGDELGTLRGENAAQLGLLTELALDPGSRGWQVGFLWAPPLAHWVAFGLGVFALRKHAWLAVLGALALALAADHEAVQLWVDSPLGEVVRFPRRYVLLTGLAFALLAGVGLRVVPKRAELVVGVLAAAYVAGWGAHAGGWVNGYPSVELPELTFAQVLAADSEDAAVLIVPYELPGAPEQQRNEAPVFASLGDDLASSDLLYLQTRVDKGSLYAPALLTLAPREGVELSLPKNLNDLAFASVGQDVPGSAKQDADAYRYELAWLTGEGLKYVVVDEARYGEDELGWLEVALKPWTLEKTRYADGTGVLVYRLYFERPARTDPPKERGW